MGRVMDHPRWNKSWATPDKVTIDDLAELGFLRVEAFEPNSNRRVFSLTMSGPAEGSALITPTPRATPEPSSTSVPAAKSDATAKASPPTAVISWAHGDQGWQAAVAEFAFRLRELGIDVDSDLWHLHDPCVNWSTYGPQAIQDREFVLIPVSTAYRERWEGKAAPDTGAGAAREANTLKALFDRDQQAFQRKVKIVILPGASLDDIPTELRAIAQRFDVPTIDPDGLEHLLRTLTAQPEFVAPPVGSIPLLPPKHVGQGSKPRPVPEPSQAAVDAIAALPERERLIVALTYFERMTRTEIAEILGVSQNEVSQLAQDATSRLGDWVSTDLAAKTDQAVSDQNHSARHALLADGPRTGELLPVEPSQLMLAVPERFDFDQGCAEVIDHYAYEGPTGDRDTVVFTFRHQENRVVTGD